MNDEAKLLVVTEHLQPWRQGDWPTAYDLLSLDDFVRQEETSADEVAPANRVKRMHLSFTGPQSTKIRECLIRLGKLDPENWAKALNNPSDAVFEILMRWLKLAVEFDV